MTQYIFKTLWVPAVLIALLVVSVSSLIQTAKGGTTSLIFNNVEQGPNSTANPSIVVDGNGKVVKKSEDGKTLQQYNTDAASPTAEVSSVPAAQTTTVVSEVAQPARSTRRSWFKMGMAYHALTSNRLDQTGGTLSLTLMPLRGFGISAFGGIGSKHQNFYGGELEVLPLRLSLFDFEDFVELGGTLGVSSLGTLSKVKGTVHFGPKIQVNFGPHYSIVASYRTNISDRAKYTYGMVDAGLTIRF